MPKRVDPIVLPTYPQLKDENLVQYLKTLTSNIQWFADQVQNTIDSFLVPEQANVFGQVLLAGSTTLTETFSPVLTAGTTYTCLVVPNWLTTWAVTSRTTAAVTISFGTAPTPSNGLVDIIVILQTLPG